MLGEGLFGECMYSMNMYISTILGGSSDPPFFLQERKSIVWRNSIGPRGQVGKTFFNISSSACQSHLPN